MDQAVRLYDIARNKAECLMTLRHPCHIGSLSLSPDNSLLAVGGQNQDLYIWSLKDQRLLRTLVSPSAVELTGSEYEANAKAVFDINWSSDGTIVAAGLEKSVVMVDMRKILLDHPSAQPSALGPSSDSVKAGSQSAGGKQQIKDAHRI